MTRYTNDVRIPARVAATVKPGLLQAKLRVNRPGDAFEKEADRVAEAVVSGRRDGIASSSSPVQVQRAGSESQAASRQTDGLGAPALVNDVLGQPGQPLDLNTQTFMGNRFGHDFSRIRIHSDSRAAVSAKAVNALAYTVGSNIVFGERQFAPETSRGKRLLAHELTHVLQQGGQSDRLQRYGMDNAPYGDPDRDVRLREFRSRVRSTPQPVEVTAIDDVDAVGWLESFFSLGEINFTDVTTMVDNILTAIGSNQMSRLNIQVHGSPTSVAVGSTGISTANFATHQPTLSRLSGHFTSSGFVHLRACDVGQNPALMQMFASAFGVPVYAGTGTQRNIFYPSNTGNYLRCDAAACAPSSRP